VYGGTHVVAVYYGHRFCGGAALEKSPGTGRTINDAGTNGGRSYDIFSFSLLGVLYQFSTDRKRCSKKCLLSSFPVLKVLKLTDLVGISSVVSYTSVSILSVLSVSLFYGSSTKRKKGGGPDWWGRHLGGSGYSRPATQVP
jgi:hypothetical protein